MATILVVDDEADIRDRLGQVLSRAGHDVTLASTGNEAIELGAAMRPDVLVADWLLKSDIHGLHVSQVLQAVDPRTETILITGFMSPELREEAASLGVFDVLEKPFEPDALVSSVALASRADRTDRAVFQLAVAEVDREGAIVFANPEALEFFSRVRPGKATRHLRDLLRPERIPDLLKTSTWLSVAPDTTPRTRWHFHGKAMPDGHRLLVLLTADQIGSMVYHPLVQMLLSSEAPPHLKWPFEGRVLVVDDEELIRRFALAVFDQAGATCHVAPDTVTALDLLRRDEGVRVVLLDWDIPGSDVPRFARDLRAMADRVSVVGHSGLDRRADFSALGIPRFVPKPWRIHDVVEVLTERIDSCGGCGLRIPLRKALSGESARVWRCCGCGWTVSALVDTRAEAGHLFNVEPDIPEDVEAS